MSSSKEGEPSTSSTTPKCTITEEAIRSVLGSVKCANGLPTPGDEWEYYSSFSGFQKAMEEQKATVLTMMQNTLGFLGVKKNLSKKDPDEIWEVLNEVNEAFVERANTSLDEAEGLRMRKKAPTETLEAEGKELPSSVASWNKIAGKTKTVPATSTVHKLGTMKAMDKPQLKFIDKVDNTSSTPFIPKLKDKPNSLKPLAILPLYNEDGTEYYGHPYEYELMMLHPSESDLSKRKVKVSKPFDETPFTFVTTPEELNVMMEDLKKQKEIAIDLEHHSYRSFQGFTCLIQISTRESDYVIDPLPLRHHLHCLNEVFTKASIVKVLHGADMDIQWLQCDFGVYIVNMFDTYQAAKLLNYPRLGLAMLLAKLCNVIANKEYQLADWRVRPIPDPMMKYARQDTHYLLFIYDCLKNELLQKGNEQKNLLKSTLQQSKDVCLVRYEKPQFSETSHLNFYRRGKRFFNNRQMAALKDLYRWRDETARKLDESLGYVLPNHMLLQICDTLPREMQGILSCCNPVPPVVRKSLSEIHKFIYKARELPLETIAIDSTRDILPSQLTVDIDSILHCPHDMSHDELRDDLPTVVQIINNAPVIQDTMDTQVADETNPAIRVTCCTKPAITVLHKGTQTPSSKFVSSLNFTSPYARFLLYREAKKLYEDLKKKSAKIDTSALDPRVKSLVEFYIENEPDPVKELAAQKEAEPPPQIISSDDDDAIPLIRQLPRKRHRDRRHSPTPKPPPTADAPSDNDDDTAHPSPPKKPHSNVSFSAFNYSEVDYDGSFGGGGGGRKQRHHGRGPPPHGRGGGRGSPRGRGGRGGRFQNRIPNPTAGRGKSYTYRQ